MATTLLFEQGRTDKAVDALQTQSGMCTDKPRVAADAVSASKHHTRTRSAVSPLHANRSTLSLRRSTAAALRELTFLVALLLTLPSFAADSIPAAPVQFTLPHSPRNRPEALARRLAELMSRQWKELVVVVNKAGANGCRVAQQRRAVRINGHSAGSQGQIRANRGGGTARPFGAGLPGSDWI